MVHWLSNRKMWGSVVVVVLLFFRFSYSKETVLQYFGMGGGSSAQRFNPHPNPSFSPECGCAGCTGEQGWLDYYYFLRLWFTLFASKLVWSSVRIVGMLGDMMGQRASSNLFIYLLPTEIHSWVALINGAQQGSLCSSRYVAKCREQHSFFFFFFKDLPQRKD